MIEVVEETTLLLGATSEEVGSKISLKEEEEVTILAESVDEVTLLEETVTEESTILSETTEEVIEKISKPASPEEQKILTNKWQEYTELLNKWYSSSIVNLDKVLEDHYSTAQKLLQATTGKGGSGGGETVNDLKRALEKLTKKINNPGDEILDELYLQIIGPKIRDLPTQLKEPWDNAVKQIEYKFSQDVQPKLETYSNKLKNISTATAAAAPPSAKISSLAAKFEVAAVPTKDAKPSPSNNPTSASKDTNQSNKPATTARGGRAGGRRGGRTNRFANSALMGNSSNKGDVQKMLNTLSQIAAEISDEED